MTDITFCPAASALSKNSNISSIDASCTEDKRKILDGVIKRNKQFKCFYDPIIDGYGYGNKRINLYAIAFI